MLITWDLISKEECSLVALCVDQYLSYDELGLVLLS